MRVETGSPLSAAYLISSAGVSLAVLPLSANCVAVVLTVAPSLCGSSPAIATCRCGPKILESKVRESFESV